MTDQFRTSPSCLIDWHGVWENEHLFIQMTAFRQERHKDVPYLDKRKRRLFCFLVDTGRECVGTHRETINDFLNQPSEPHHSLKNVSDKLYYSPNLSNIAKYVMTFHHEFTIKFYHHKFIIINVLSFNTMYKN